MDGDGKPKIDDQTRIATLLSKVESLIAKRKKSIADLDELLKSAFLEMFGDPVRNEMGWDRPELKQFGKYHLYALGLSEACTMQEKHLKDGIPFIIIHSNGS